jgi:hypothetical protein
LGPVDDDIVRELIDFGWLAPGEPMTVMYVNDAAAIFGELVVARVDEAVGDLSRELAEAKAGISRLRCELIEARNPGIEDDPQWKAERARRLEETA